MEKFKDVRYESWSKEQKEYSFEGLNSNIIKTLTFNERTIFPDELIEIKTALLEKGKNPGLGIKKLHQQGITGENVTIAIIDQPIRLDHPEYDGKILKYKNFDEEAYNGQSSMHGPAVLSLLVGETLGVAPNAKVIYAATPSWKANQNYVIKAIEWIIEQNKVLSKNDKIRAISISASPPSWSKKGLNHLAQNKEEYNKNLEIWEKIEKKALDNDIVIISCVQNKYKIGACYYDLDDPDNIELVKGGFPNKNIIKSDCLLVPTSLRTIAEYYEDGIKSYTYEGVGGLSWGIPYLCGCLALAWQINPNISGIKMMDYVYNTAFKKEKLMIINPSNFIKEIYASRQIETKNQ